MKKSTLSSLGLFLTLAVVGSAQADSLPTRAEMWEMLQRQNQEIQALKARLNQSEKKVDKAVAQVESSTESHSGGGMKWSDRINISGSVAVQATSGDSYTGVDSSDITVATAELAIDTQINDWVSTNITLLYEEDDTALTVDSATITLANPEKSPFSFTFGSMGLPFGGYATNLLSDPLTQSLGETAETAALISVSGGGLTASAYGFNGSAQTGENVIDQFGFSLGYAGESGPATLDIGAGWINSLEDSDTIGGLLPNNIGNMINHISGGEIHGILGFKGFTLIGEYVTALEDFDMTELTWNGNKARPSAWTAEIGYTFMMAEKETTIAVGYQESDEALGLGLPEKTILGGISVGIFENTTLAFEWKHDKDYGTSDSTRVDNAAAATTGTGKKKDMATLKLTVDF
ncbi:MAG: LbtU family siderophore porin [Magnetococcales bacterium]|nr:LbtU family siderophore porin [Magnetococcales bacterium]